MSNICKCILNPTPEEMGGGTPEDKVGGRWTNGNVGVSEKSKILSNAFI